MVDTTRIVKKIEYLWLLFQIELEVGERIVICESFETSKIEKESL